MDDFIVFDNNLISDYEMVMEMGLDKDYVIVMVCIYVCMYIEV